MVASLCTVVILILACSIAGMAQSGGIIAGARDPNAPAAKQARLLLNREPVLYLDLKKELVEITPGGINVLQAASERPTRTSGRTMRYLGMRVGGNSLSSLRLEENGYVTITTRLLQLNADGIVLEVVVKDQSGNTIASRNLALKNYEEGIIELAATPTSNKRLAVRLLPRIKAIEPLQDYPALVPRFGTMNGLVIRNDKDVISRGGTEGTVDDLNGPNLQFNTLDSPQSGRLVFSYRPFPGAVLAGEVQGRELNFEWNGDLYEWISLDEPFLPEGRWAIYVWQTGPATTQGVGFGGFEADPNDLVNFLDRMKSMKRMGIGGAVKK